MSKSNLGKRLGSIKFFRVCLCTLIIFTLAMGSMALKTEPVNAALDISPAAGWNSPDLPECVPFVGPTFTPDGFTCVNPPQNVFFWLVDTGEGVPTWVEIDPVTGVLSGCPVPGSLAGSPYNFGVVCTELCVCPPTCTFASCGIPCSDVSLTTAPITLNIVANPQPCDMVITPVFYPVAWENVPFTMTLGVTGGSGTYEWGAIGLPVGLSVTDNVNGIISGVPAPGTCGIYTVTANVTDTGTCCPAGECCCPPVSRPFVLIVDCLANYIFTTYYTTACDFGVEIGQGLTQGSTQVLIDGLPEAILEGGESAFFTSVPCQSHLVTVEQVVSTSDPKIRLAVIGSNQKMVTDSDNYAYFDYRPEYLIETGSEPAGVSEPAGSGFYAVGSTFSTTTPSPIQSSNMEGVKYVFRDWSLPDGSTQSGRDIWFTVNTAGYVKAKYDTYYMLRLKSENPSVDDISWHLKDSIAEWDLALPAVPLDGCMGFLGGKLIPVNPSGTQSMTGPYTGEILWKADYTWPIIFIVLILLVIGGLGYFIYRLKTRTTKPAVSKKKTATKESGSRSEVKPSRRTGKTGARKRTSTRTK